MPLNLTRSLLVVLIPGIIAFAPWLIWAVREFENIAALYTTFKEAVTVGVFAAVVVFGAVIEIINSWIESRWDETREGEFAVTENWYSYLAHAVEKESIGYGYISRMVTTMYFELALMWAFPAFALGLVVMNVTSATTSNSFCGVAALLGIAFSVGSYQSAKESHRVLCKTRLEINKRVRS